MRFENSARSKTSRRETKHYVVTGLHELDPTDASSLRENALPGHGIGQVAVILRVHALKLTKLNFNMVNGNPINHPMGTPCVTPRLIPVAQVCPLTSCTVSHQGPQRDTEAVC